MCIHGAIKGLTQVRKWSLRSGVLKDYRDGRKKRMTLPVFEFMRRFLQHVLPSGFHKVRYYGFFSPGSRKKLLRVRMFLYQSSKYPVPVPEDQNSGSLGFRPDPIL